MSILNAVSRTVFDLLLAPFSSLAPWVGLTLISLLVSIFMLLVFKATSNQEALKAVKNQIHAGLFEIRLFNDDLRAILRAQFEILGLNARYLRLSLVPMAWILPPLFLVVAQMQFHYAYGGFEPGDQTLLTVALADTGQSDSQRPLIELEAPEGILVETPGVWVPSRNEMTWRLGIETEGDYEVLVQLGDATYAKSLRAAGDRIVRRSPIKVGAGILDQLIFPAESPLGSEAGLHSIELSYPDRDIEYFGYGAHWMVWFFALSMIFAFALRNRLGVTI